MNTHEEFDDLKNDAPKLHSMDKKNPFVVPEHYFETLTSRIQDRIAQENKQPQWIKMAKSLLLPKVAIPALACCLMMGIGIKYLVQPTAIIVTEETAITYDELNSTEYINLLDEEQIVTAIAEQKEMTTNTTEIEDYLIENNIDECELISALN